LTALGRLAGEASRVGSVCCGAFLLAAAGLLDGCRVTTHWSLVGDFRRRFPGIDVDGDALFVANGKFHTAAGISAGIDYALYLIEQDLGRQRALEVARELVVFLKRPGGQAQFSAELATQTATAAQARFARLQSWICAHVDEDLSVPRLAERMAMSPRNFTRRFTDAIGVAPSLYVQRARIDAARRMLSEGNSPLERVAQRCGFSSAEAMRLTFLRHLAVTPQDFRARFSSANDGLP
jgi:transcriptional regulator GlxA family with amidase domain